MLHKPPHISRITSLFTMAHLCRSHSTTHPTHLSVHALTDILRTPTTLTAPPTTQTNPKDAYNSHVRVAVPGSRLLLANITLDGTITSALCFDLGLGQRMERQKPVCDVSMCDRRNNCCLPCFACRSLPMNH